MPAASPLLFTEALGLHLLLTGSLLALVSLALQRRGLLHFLSAGFWAAASFALYFFAVPLLQWLTGELTCLETRLAVTEGVSRLLWVSGCVQLGLAAFFGAYLKTGLRPVTLGLRDRRLSGVAWLLLALSLAAAAYSLIMFRGSFAAAKCRVVIESGRFTGDITGYQYMAHLFALYPLALLVFQEPTRKWGVLLAGLYLAVRLEDGWDRQSAVSLLLALSMITAALQGRRWPRWPGVAAIGLVTLALTLRGHQGMGDFLTKQSLDLPTALEPLRRGGDASMLATLVLESYLADRSGYNFGLPTLNQALFGLIPRKYFPQKDEALETLLSLPPPKSWGDIYGSEMMYGAKSTVIGDFYNWGGILMVGLGMAGLGFLCRRFDGMLIPACPTLVRALGFLWLGNFWMLAAGHLFWILACLFLTGLPFLLLAGWQKLASPGRNNPLVYGGHPRRRFPAVRKCPDPPAP